jgi:hypothetical protein
MRGCGGLFRYAADLFAGNSRYRELLAMPIVLPGKLHMLSLQNVREPLMKDFADAAFAPDVIKLMADALEASVATLPDPVNSSRVAELAESILRTAKSGERDAVVLQRIALLEIQIAPRRS